MNESGEMMNTSFLDYRIPVILDLPMIDTVIVEVANEGHPNIFGNLKNSLIPLLLTATCVLLKKHPPLNAF